MCGIVGLFSFDGPPVGPEQIRAMTDRVAHRGPDGVGLWMSGDRRIGLGHRRLSIIDLSDNAAQPMSNHDGSIQLVYNGEIFNHAELRRELSAIGDYRWRTDHSDTEVVINAFQQWGPACLDRFRGDFAIALWDERNRRLWLARDRAGVKPLYYTSVPGGIAFASEIKALFALPGVRRKVNEQAVYDYLSFLTPPAPDTMFDGIYKLPAATWLMIDSNGRQIDKRYWDPFGATNPLVGVDEATIAEMVLQELRTSVRYRKESDVPVGIFLSGGIDSSANAVLFAEGGDTVRTFSIGYDADYTSYRNELPFAAETAERIGAIHHVRRLGAHDVTEMVERMVYHQDEPIGDAVCVPLYYVAKLARDAGVTVCQVGEGADELFCGYPFWNQHLRIARWDALPVPRFAKHAALGMLNALGQGGTYPYELLRRSASGEPTFWGGAEGMVEHEKRSVLGVDLKRRFAGRTSAEALEPIRTRFLANSWEQSALNWMTYLDLNLRLPELLLSRVDKMTMASSVEGRVPYLDHKFIELALSIPTATRSRPKELKRVLKRAVRGVLPDTTIDRPKQGFGLPLNDWLKGDLGDEIIRRIGSFADETGILDRKASEALMKGANWSKSWQLYNLALWHDRFITGDGNAP